MCLSVCVRCRGASGRTELFKLSKSVLRSQKELRRVVAILVVNSSVEMWLF